MQSLRRLAFAGGTIGVVWASPAAANDWATPITAVQKNLADAGVNLGFGVTEFGQGLAAGDGTYGIPFGGKVDVLLGLDGGRLGLWNGFGVSAHFEQEFGQNANMQGDGSIIPVNTALAFPLLGGTTTDLSLNFSQKFGDNVSISLGKFNTGNGHAGSSRRCSTRRRPHRSSAEAERPRSGTSVSPRPSAASRLPTL